MPEDRNVPTKGALGCKGTGMPSSLLQPLLDRLTVGREALNLVVGVRIPVQDRVLHGRWRPTGCNPVVFDIRGSIPRQRTERSPGWNPRDRDARGHSTRTLHHAPLPQLAEGPAQTREVRVRISGGAPAGRRGLLTCRRPCALAHTRNTTWVVAVSKAVILRGSIPRFRATRAWWNW